MLNIWWKKKKFTNASKRVDRFKVAGFDKSLSVYDHGL
jgi:hypothetical protein